MDEKQHGKFGKDRHFELTKKALIHVVDNYWETFGIIKVENTSISMHASLDGVEYISTRGEYDLHPDIVMTIKRHDPGILPSEKIVIVECETSTNGLLKDEMRLTAYKLLRLRTSDKNKLMMYLAFPSELKGKVSKPECFNDLWFFDIPQKFFDVPKNEGQREG